MRFLCFWIVSDGNLRIEPGVLPFLPLLFQKLGCVELFGIITYRYTNVVRVDLKSRSISIASGWVMDLSLAWSVKLSITFTDKHIKSYKELFCQKKANLSQLFCCFHPIKIRILNFSEWLPICWCAFASKVGYLSRCCHIGPC